MTKHWEAELEALKGNNAKLTAALLESTANVKQWKQQLAAYQEEAERLHKRVRDGTQECLFSCVIHENQTGVIIWKGWCEVKMRGWKKNREETCILSRGRERRG